MASDLRLKQIFRLMGGLQGIVAVCSRSAFALRGVSGGADAQLCLFSLASLAPVQTLSSLHKKAPPPSNGTDARTVPNMWPLSNAAPPQLRPIEAGLARFEKHKMLDRGKRSDVGEAF